MFYSCIFIIFSSIHIMTFNPLQKESVQNTNKYLIRRISTFGYKYKRVNLTAVQHHTQILELMKLPEGTSLYLPRHLPTSKYGMLSEIHLGNINLNLEKFAINVQLNQPQCQEGAKGLAVHQRWIWNVLCDCA